MRRLVFSALLLALAGCEPILGTEYTLPPDAVPTDPAAVYATWYAETEACTGETGDYPRVRWFEVPGERWFDALRNQYAVATWRAPHDIYITTAHLRDPDVVKHEIIHDLLHGGASDDPRFLECSNITH